MPLALLYNIRQDVLVPKITLEILWRDVKRWNVLRVKTVSETLTFVTTINALTCASLQLHAEITPSVSHKSTVTLASVEKDISEILSPVVDSV